MKFLIADDHELFLQGLEFILHKQYPEAEILLTNSYTGIFEVLEKQKDFELIITDLAMPGANWLEAISRVHSLCPEVPIIIISAVFDPEILQKTYDIGVSGYVSKAFPNNIILSAINLVMAGGMYIPPELLNLNLKNRKLPIHDLIEDLNESPKSVRENKVLTPRQTEVFKCLSEGLSNKQIAYRLGLSEGTVKIHITLLMRALEVSNRMQAVREARHRGLLQDSDA